MSQLHSLSNDEIQSLHPLLKNLHEQSDEVVKSWYRLYVSQLGEGRVLSEEEFSSIMSPLVRRSTTALLSGDIEEFERLARALGERLARRGVSFFEVILSLHFCQESIETAHAAELSCTVECGFAKLCHTHATFVADGYIRTEQVGLPRAAEQLEDDSSQPPLDAALDARRGFHGLLGASLAMRGIYDRIEAAGRARGTVLVIGESGTGKELVARAIHQAGPNPDAPFVAVNCSAIPRDLIESELFGHKRGAFSGANFDYLGLFRAAEGGTLFLDEITEMNLETQSKLLRALQEHMVRPVGSVTEIPVRVRVVASTNRRPEEAVKTGLLREDLYYRLAANLIEIPPLRERSQDIALLTSHFIRIFNAEAGPAVPVTGIAQDAMAAMLRHSWPGNVRELSNAIESAVTFGRTSRIRLKDLPQNVRRTQAEAVQPPIDRAAPIEIAGAPARQSGGTSPKTFDETERELIERTLQMAGHNKTYAAELLKISRKKLYARLVKYGLLHRSRRARRASYLPTHSIVCNP